METMLRREVLPPRQAPLEPCDFSSGKRRRTVLVLALLWGIVPAVIQIVEKLS